MQRGAEVVIKSQAGPVVVITPSPDRAAELRQSGRNAWSYGEVEAIKKAVAPGEVLNKKILLTILKIQSILGGRIENIKRLTR